MRVTRQQSARQLASVPRSEDAPQPQQEEEQRLHPQEEQQQQHEEVVEVVQGQAIGLPTGIRRLFYRLHRFDEFDMARIPWYVVLPMVFLHACLAFFYAAFLRGSSPETAFWTAAFVLVVVAFWVLTNIFCRRTLGAATQQQSEPVNEYELGAISNEAGGPHDQQPL